MKNKYKRNKSRRFPKIFPVLFLLFIFITIILIGFTAYRYKFLPTKASGCPCSDPNYCYTDCTRNVVKDPNVCNSHVSEGPHVYEGEDTSAFCINPPECCQDMITLNDSSKCCWVERYFCRPEQCNQVFSNRNGCGWYWTFHDQAKHDGLGTNTPGGYGCMIGDSAETMKPLYPVNPAPTSPLVKSSPTVVPTSISLPTEPIIYQPTAYIPQYRPPTSYIPPTSPPIHNQPNQPPITSQITPTTISPTFPPIISTITKDTNDFLQKFRISFLQFINTILP